LRRTTECGFSQVRANDWYTPEHTWNIVALDGLEHDLVNSTIDPPHSAAAKCAIPES
jgi:hypothetical protein